MMPTDTFNTQADSTSEYPPSLYFFAAPRDPELTLVKAMYEMQRNTSYLCDTPAILPLFKSFLAINFARHIPAERKHHPIEAIQTLCNAAISSGLETLDDLARQLNDERSNELLETAAKAITGAQHIPQECIEDIRDIDEIALNKDNLFDLFAKYLPKDFLHIVEDVVSNEAHLITFPSQRLRAVSQQPR